MKKCKVSKQVGLIEDIWNIKTAIYNSKICKQHQIINYYKTCLAMKLEYGDITPSYGIHLEKSKDSLIIGSRE